MNKGMRRSLWIMLLALVSIAGSVHAQTWTSIPMTVVAKVGTEQLNARAPYALGFPPAAAPSMRRYLSTSSQSSLKGFRIRGYAVAIGSGTNPHNQLSSGFTNSTNFTGTEYGLVVYLPDGLLRLYQCLDCNTPSIQWSETVVFNTPQDFDWYEVLVNTDGSFTVTVINAASGQTFATVNVPKQSWLPNLYNTSGYLHITANHGVTDGTWLESVLHVDEIDILH